MTAEEVFFFLSFLLGLCGIVAIAVGVITAVLIGEGEVKFTDTVPLLKNTKVPLGGRKRG